ncbi:MAG: hypothetical protein ACREJC_22395 [Tepidisphaeraceae bacterium]
MAKAGLSTLTHGVSDKVFEVLKSRGESKPLTAKLSTIQQQALANKLLQAAGPPRTQRIDEVLEDASNKQRYGLAGRRGGIPRELAAKRAAVSGKQRAPFNFFETVSEAINARRAKRKPAKRAKKTPRLNGGGPNGATGGAVVSLSRVRRKRKPARQKGLKKDGTPRKPPSAAQLAQRERFKAMVAARRK